MRRQARWWRYRYNLALVGGLLALTLGFALVAAALKGKSGVSGAAGNAALVSFTISIVTTVCSLWSWWRTAVAPSMVTSQQIATGKDVLAYLVAQQWQTEAAIRSLDDPDPIPVQWQITGNDHVMDHPENLTSASLILSGSSDDIASLTHEFRLMRRRRLVLLGGPGTGKTTLAVQLVRELLATRTQHGDEPVPVLLSAAGWDTTVFPLLHDWLATRLAQDYPALRALELGPEMPEKLVSHGQILPVLDGLDELSKAGQAAVITALNRSLKHSDQLILTSRTEEFGQAIERAGDVLTSAVVIEPEPVRPTAAASYLHRCLPPRSHSAWEQVLAGLRGATASRSGPVGALAEITITPLGLWLVRTVYISADADPSVLLDPKRFPDVAALRAHLFEELIPALIDARRPSDNRADIFRPRNRYDPVQARRWLGYLARHLSRVQVTEDTIGTRDFAWWRLARDTNAITPRTRVAAGLAVLFASGLASGLAAELAAALTFGLTFGLTAILKIGLTFGLLVGLAAGFTVGLAARSWPAAAPGFADLRIRGRMLGLGRRLMTVLAPGLAVGVIIWLLDRFTAVLAVGLTVGLAASSALGVMMWVEAPTQSGPPASTPLGSWHADRSLTIARVIAFGFAFALAIGLAVGLTIGSAFGSAFGFSFAYGFTFTFTARLTVGLVFGLVFGLAGGLAGGLGTGAHRAWVAYVIATYRLAWTRQLPRRLMLFLDDAHRLGLLRAVGPVYQFRHAEFQDHLAATYRDKTRNSPWY